MPISCQLHDYIEIACLYGYSISLTLKQGQNIEGKALTTETSADRQELLVIQSDIIQRKINLTEIKSMRALTQNPNFTEIHF